MEHLFLLSLMGEPLRVFRQRADAEAYAVSKSKGPITFIPKGRNHHVVDAIGGITGAISRIPFTDAPSEAPELKRPQVHDEIQGVVLTAYDHDGGLAYFRRLAQFLPEGPTLTSTVKGAVTTCYAGSLRLGTISQPK